MWKFQNFSATFYVKLILTKLKSQNRPTLTDLAALNFHISKIWGVGKFTKFPHCGLGLKLTNPEKWSSFILALSIYSETLWKSNTSRANSIFRKSNVVNLQNFWTFSKTFRFSCSLWRYEKNYKQSTMLQKLSKCEVKALLYWNLIILPPLRFYVNQILLDSIGPKM